MDQPNPITIDPQGLLFITCVDMERGHPSGRLAAKYNDYGVDVVTLFENSRDLRAILRDALTLWRRTRAQNYVAGLVNVNGSIAQLAALTVFSLRRIPMSLWIMDSYPGCLRYVTQYWWAFWFPFYLASLAVKAKARAVFVIDEAFGMHSPTGPAARARVYHVPLPISAPPFEAKEIATMKPTIGILGNIEQDWLDNDFAAFFERARAAGFQVLIATSRPITLPVAPSLDLEVIAPWPKEDTDRVFAACDCLLVPLSTARLVYSSPSKIVEAYSRGLQPVVMTDTTAWEANRHRLVYQRCVLESEFFAGKPVHSTDELRHFATHWTDKWRESIDITLALSMNCRS